MNVAIFTDNDFDKVNGVTTSLSATLDHAPPGMRLRVYTASALGVDAPHYLALASVGIPIPFYREMSMYLARPGRFIRHAVDDRIDVVHLTTPGPVGVAALRTASKLRLPLVGSFHTDLAAYAAVLSGSRHASSVMRGYLRWMYSRCSRILVPSEHTRELLIKARTDANRISVWPRGVNTTLFSPDRRAPWLRERWHVADHRPALLYVGRLSREKGLDLLPALHDALHTRGVQHRFIIVGEGPMRDDLHWRMPDAFFTGVLFGPVLAEVYASADLFVFPSHTDTAGNVVLEAQASGLPVIVSGDGGPRENMLPDRTGVVCRGADPAEWAANIANVLQPRSRKCAMGRAAREYALTRRWETALQPLYLAYRDVMTAPPVGVVQPVWVSSEDRRGLRPDGLSSHPIVRGRS